MAQLRELAPRLLKAAWMPFPLVVMALSRYFGLRQPRRILSSPGRVKSSH